MRNPAEEYALARRLPIPELVKVMQGQSDAVSLAVAHSALKEKTDAQKAQQGIAASQVAMMPKVKDKDIEEAMGIGSLNMPVVKANGGLFVEDFGAYLSNQDEEETEEEKKRRLALMADKFPEQAKEILRVGSPNIFERGAKVFGFDVAKARGYDQRLKNLGYTEEQIADMPPEMKRYIIERRDMPAEKLKPEIKTTLPGQAPGQAPGQTPGQQPSGNQSGAPSGDLAQRGGLRSLGMVKDILGQKAPEFDLKKATEELGASLPDTATSKIEEMIARREKSLEGRREENKGMALLEAGLAGLAAGDVRKGMMYGLRAYKEGMNDIRKGEEFIESAKIDMAKATDARQRGLADLAIKLQANAEDKFAKGQQLGLTGANIVAQVETAGIRGAGRTADTTASPSEQKAAGELAKEQLQPLVMSGELQPGSPEYLKELERLKREILLQSGKNYTPISTGAVSSDGPLATYSR